MAYAAAMLFLFAKITEIPGPPAKRSFVGERRSTGMNELFALCAETNDMEVTTTI